MCRRPKQTRDVLQVYYCGGIFKHNPDGQTGTMCAKYNVKQDSWDEKVASMAEGRNHAATCTDGERMFVFAGRGPGSGSNNVVANGYANTQIYDPSNDSWVSGPQSVRLYFPAHIMTCQLLLATIARMHGRASRLCDTVCLLTALSEAEAACLESGVR